MPEDDVVIERHNRVELVRINRPNIHNALDVTSLAALGNAVVSAVECPEVRAVVITGTGEKAFSAGADLDQLRGLDAMAAQDVLSHGQHVLARIEHSPIPVIAAVNGLALGGGFELVLASTFAVLSTKASFALPESGLGLIPGYGGTQRLSRVVGPAVAAHVMLTGARISADRAYEVGLTPVPPVAPEELLSTALELAGSLAARGPRATTAILRALRVNAAAQRELAFETALAALATGSEEAAEGIAAFKERRTPQFDDAPRSW